tara:strand:+ start:79 stop:2007 length:1929 start_codon:yes stop_codon:yes gene_type:complete
MLPLLSKMASLSTLSGPDKQLDAPFTSINGFRRSPPPGAGIDCYTCARVQTAKDSWIEPTLVGGDFMDHVEAILTLNASRICEEYMLESEVKIYRASGGVKLTIDPNHAESVRLVSIDSVFRPSDLTYGSWTLMYALRRAAIKCKLVLVPGRGGFSAAPAYLVALFKAYDKVCCGDAKGVLIKSQNVANLFVKALYGFDESTKEYSVSSYGAVAKAFVGVDKNFIQSFKKAWVDSHAMLEYTRLSGKGKTCVTDDLWAVATPPMFKMLRESAEAKRTTHKIQNPVIVNEKNFRRVVGDMLDVVFGGVMEWDCVEIPYKLDKKGKEDAAQRERFNTALCLLQLGIGSRSRGIIAVNQIETFDTPVSRGLSALNSLDHLMALRVKNLTKDKPSEWKAYKTYKKMSEFDSDFTMSDAQSSVDTNEQNAALDKPVQYYLFDPVSHDTSRGRCVDPSDYYRFSEKHPREIFMQLFKTCRDYVYSKHPDLIEWTSYESGARTIRVAARSSHLSAEMGLLYRSVYPGMKAVCAKYLKTYGLGLESYGTHELRRLYVCYSFEFFGRGKTKEIAYAQYVLRHASLSSAVYYTTLQFDMFLGKGSADQIAVHEKLLTNVCDVEASINVLKRKLASLEDEVVQKMICRGSDRT